jgi:hypothetical protein
MSSSATSSAAGTPLRQAQSADESDEEESDAFVLRATPMAPLFTPAPLTRPQTAQQQSSGLSVSQRLGRELTPQAGRLADLRSAPARASIFPSDASASSSGVSSGAGSTAEVAVLQHGLAQILATKDSAKRYIERQITAQLRAASAPFACKILSLTAGLCACVVCAACVC